MIYCNSFKSKNLAMINDNCKVYQYNRGDLVYIYITPYQSAKNKFKKGYHKLHRTISCLPNSGSSQLSIDDIRWKNI